MDRRADAACRGFHVLMPSVPEVRGDTGLRRLADKSVVQPATQAGPGVGDGGR